MITMLGSTVLGGVMSIWSQSIKAKQAEQNREDAMWGGIGDMFSPTSWL